jgi:DNA-binding response OmpR family regulator
MRRLLLVDDDRTLAGLLAAVLSGEGYELLWADRPSQGRALLAQQPELLLLDVMLPEQDGFSFCKALRDEGVALPIIMLTARGGELDRVEGLRLGADDYLPKPFHHLELIARIEAVLRRSHPNPSLGTQAQGQDGLDVNRRALRLGGELISLTPMEYRLMEAFAGAPGRTFTRGELLERLDEAGASEAFDRAIDLHIKRLRAKLEPEAKAPRHLLTVRGAGYRFEW